MSIRIEPHAGPREALRPLFELAEDSAAALDGYLNAGRVLVARDDGAIVGHLQVTETGVAGELELKNMAVAGSHRRRRIGSLLVAAAIGLAREESRRRMVVATAAADVDNLRFYQRQGFRLESIERDAFTPATRYDAGTLIDGIELRDRVWLDLAL